jgi:hypothetical protein
MEPSQLVGLEAHGLEERQGHGETLQTPRLPHLHQHSGVKVQHSGLEVQVVGARKLIWLVERQI